MKQTLLIGFLLGAVALQAADDKDLPPGLRKKDKLPPGIAKKQGRAAEEERSVTNSVTVTNVVTKYVTNNVPSSGPAGNVTTPTPATRRQVRLDLDKHAHAINALDDREAVRRAGLAAISTETGVSVSTLQKQHREHETVGTAGLLIANTIAAKTKRPAAAYIRQHAEGKPWERIAADNQVNLEEIDAKLAHVETAMRKAK